jgi:hypothetical protein
VEETDLGAIGFPPGILGPPQDLAPLGAGIQVLDVKPVADLPAAYSTWWYPTCTLWRGRHDGPFRGAARAIIAVRAR